MCAYRASGFQIPSTAAPLAYERFAIFAHGAFGPIFRFLEISTFLRFWVSTRLRKLRISVTEGRDAGAESCSLLSRKAIFENDYDSRQRGKSRIQPGGIFCKIGLLTPIAIFLR